MVVQCIGLYDYNRDLNMQLTTLRGNCHYYSPYPKVPFFGFKDSVLDCFQIHDCFLLQPLGSYKSGNKLLPKRPRRRVLLVIYNGQRLQQKLQARPFLTLQRILLQFEIAFRFLLYVYQLTVDDTVIRCCYSKNLAKKFCPVLIALLLGFARVLLVG